MKTSTTATGAVNRDPVLDVTARRIAGVQLPITLWPIVAASGDLPWPPQSDGDARRFVAHCASEGLLPILFEAQPADVSPALAGWRALNTANQHRTRTIARNIESLRELIGEEFALLKGSDYGYRLYAAPELRPQVDIDVLVLRERVDAVTERLQRFPRVYLHNTHRSPRWPDRSFDLGDVTLEVHHSIVQRSRARIDYDALWQRRVPFRGAARLADVDALLVSVINIAKDDLATTLVRYLDLWLMLRSDASLFDAAAARADQWRITNAFDAVMRVLGTMFPDLAIPRRRRAVFERVLPLRHAAVRRDRKRNVTRRELLWRKFWLVDGVARRALFALDTLAMSAHGWRGEAKSTLNDFSSLGR